MTHKWVILAIFLTIILTLTSVSIYASTLYGPAPTPVVYRKFVISMNLTDSRPTVQFLNSISSKYPLTYREDLLIENITPVWVATAGKEFTLYIANASKTTINQEVLLNATATANATGGVTWILKVPLYLIFPQQPVYANWYVIITENVNGMNYVVFAFETANESLLQLLRELGTVGGYLTALNGEPYYLWNYYYGYNPATESVGEYYEVGLPGISVFTMWVGQGINASSWPSSAFPEVLKVLSFSFSEYANSTLVEEASFSPNVTIGELTNYGYNIYQRPRLVPFGPVTYVSPIPLLPNGTIVSPTCLPNTYYILQVNYVTQSGYAIPIYETKNYPMGLYLLNDSLLFGGYLQAYDFFNESVIPITPVQYLMPPYKSQVTEVSWCTLRVFNLNYNYNNTIARAGDVITNGTGNSYNSSHNSTSVVTVHRENTQYITHKATPDAITHEAIDLKALVSIINDIITRILMELRLR